MTYHFNEFKSGVMADLYKLNKRYDGFSVRKVEVINKRVGVEVVVYLSHNTHALDAAIAEVIYRHKPLMVVTLGNVYVPVINKIGKRIDIRFTRLLFRE